MRADWPSLAFLLVVAANVASIAHTTHPAMLAALAAFQSLLLIGCQEAKHLCTHRTFLSSRLGNGLAGTLLGALFGVNFWAYRHFHFAHHHATCSDADPEGRLYALSWRTRWIWLLAPLEQLWVAWHINRIAWRMTPQEHRRSRNAGLAALAGFAALVGAAAVRWPHTLLWAYLVPFVLFSWMDFLLTQAEHYGVPILRSPSCRHDPATVGLDLGLPAGLSWLTLHRALHGVHHRHPGERWFTAPRRLADSDGEPVALGTFVRTWMRQGPRLWT